MSGSREGDGGSEEEIRDPGSGIGIFIMKRFALISYARLSYGSAPCIRTKSYLSA